MQQKTQSDSEQSHKVQQFMITDEQIGEIHDFVNNSLSDAYYPISQQRGQKQSEPTPLSNEELRSQRMSIDSPEARLILQSSSRQQKDEPQHQLTLFQSWNAIKFIRRISERKRINTKFSQYQYDLLNDKGSSFDLKLFKESSLHFKPMHRGLRRSNQVEQIQKPSAIQQVKSYLINQKQNIKQFFNRIEQQLSKIPLITPESRWKLIWDCFVACSRLYFMYVIPIDLGWTEIPVIYGQLYPVSVFALIILLLDYLISFNNSFYQFGQIANQRAIIAKHVITKSYGLESISLLILSIYLFNSNSNSINVLDNWADVFISLFYVQSRNIPKLIAQIEEVLNLSKPVSSMLELLKLILVLFFVLHCYSCLWFFVGEYSHNHSVQGSWLELYHIEHETFAVQYLFSFYYSTVTMFTVGYGDITPVSYIERIISIFYMMFCSIQLSYSVSTVGTILDKISAYEQEKMKKVHTINTYMQNKKIGYELQYQVREYLNYYWQSQSQVESQDEQNIINQLSQNLREQLMLQANSIILNECPLFKNHFSDQLKNKLVRQIKQTVIQPENIVEFDQIFPTLPNGQIFMCFIEHGEVQILIQNDQKDSIYSHQQVSVISKVGKGSSLGIYSFISGQKSREKFRSLGFTKLLLLSRDDFLRILPDYPEDYERFRNIHDGLLFNQDYIQHMKCFSCQSSTHRVMNCPLLHYVSDREFIIKKHLFTKDHDRQNFKRNMKRFINQFHALVDQEEISDIAQFYSSCNSKWTEFYDEPPEEEDEPKSSQIKKIDVIVASPDLTQSPIQYHRPQPRFSILNKRGSTIDALESEEYKQKLPIIARGTKRRQSNIQQLKPLEAKSCTSNTNSRRLRPSCTIEFSRFRQIQVLQRFRKIVQMVIKLNVMKKKKSSKKSLANKFLDIQQQNQQLKLILEKVIIRINQIDQGKKEILTDIDIQNAFLLSTKINMLITLQEEYFVNKSKIQQMDACKEFQYYQPQNNFTRVLEKEDFYYQQRKIQPNLVQLRKKLVQYLMFPQMYLEKYKYVKLQLVNLLTQRQFRDENNKSQIMTMSKRNKFRGKTFRAPKVNQILPK
ncbi:unnamed protein product [Paramecium pentaurelia]|uniref:Cyclic nucleotide-binding domain-containing protein n=1 Tax=Paramecium pentaurelia TaxID=43138 RepID=A0A8S1W5X9_9CILI|nr:unnamed protein product [Paramecium pentaurelia]